MKQLAILALIVCFFSLPAAAEEPAKTEPQATPAPPVAIAAAPSQTQVKIGYVDIAKIAGESAAGKAATAKMKGKNEKYRSQIKNRQKSLENTKRNIESQLPTLSPQQRQAKIKSLEKQVTEFQKYVQDAEKEMRKMEGEFTESILKSIQNAAENYGKTHGFAAIVPKRDLLYLGSMVDVQDVTEDIMKDIR
ncbi:OmpH family outer membrane protein [Geobacter benzoatilyticus]|uniref:OmpH family outer membrane protein n=1 Tax=Geobacter benzoatilyticus TaxID=2815309 RepID=A0ABX7Q208_9BACT|nr:OmpH family outer membrane protein [Geobacter benzoatilyticus]QSV45128.1 OmpH family outer membrane protein [Geobacter benzoatilyticus]